MGKLADPPPRWLVAMRRWIVLFCILLFPAGTNGQPVDCSSSSGAAVSAADLKLLVDGLAASGSGWAQNGLS
jgi:hypothetical protein